MKNFFKIDVFLRLLLFSGLIFVATSQHHHDAVCVKADDCYRCAFQKYDGQAVLTKAAKLLTLFPLVDSFNVSNTIPLQHSPQFVFLNKAPPAQRF